VVETGLGGKNLTTTIEGRQRFPIQVRLERDERDDIERLGEVLVATMSGRFVPLGQIAKIRRVTGPSEIASENGRLCVFVQANVQDRDLGGFMIVTPVIFAWLRERELRKGTNTPLQAPETLP